jgi:hypothetical protein
VALFRRFGRSSKRAERRSTNRSEELFQGSLADLYRWAIDVALRWLQQASDAQDHARVVSSEFEQGWVFVVAGESAWLDRDDLGGLAELGQGSDDALEISTSALLSYLDPIVLELEVQLGLTGRMDG